MKPKLRFPQFSNNWEAKRIDEVTEKVSIPVTVNKSELYQQIGIRSHGKGLFHKELVTGEALGNKRVFWVKENLFVVNIVFAWEQAVAKTTSAEIGMIASHRFPMFKPLDNVLDLDFLLTLFLTKKGKALLELASPGGAGRNKTLGQKEFEKTKINLPTFSEQQKIAAFLTAVDEKIQQLTKKKDLLEQYKKGVMQQIFNQEIRFKDETGNDFADWEERAFEELFERVVRKNKDNNKNVLTISAQQGLINQEEYFNKSVSARDVAGYYLLQKGEFAYNKSYSQGYPTGAIKRLVKYESGVVSPLYICFKAKENITEQFAEQYFESGLLNREIEKIAQEGARNHGLLNISVIDFFKTVMLLIPSIPEQQKIANFLSAIDAKINTINQQLEKTKEYKKGLLQQMFV